MLPSFCLAGCVGKYVGSRFAVKDEKSGCYRWVCQTTMPIEGWAQTFGQKQQKEEEEESPSGNSVPCPSMPGHTQQRRRRRLVVAAGYRQLASSAVGQRRRRVASKFRAFAIKQTKVADGGGSGRGPPANLDSREAGIGAPNLVGPFCCWSPPQISVQQQFPAVCWMGPWPETHSPVTCQRGSIRKLLLGPAIAISFIFSN
jgi:hypothetical protein